MITQSQIRLGGIAIGLLTILNIAMVIYFFFIKASPGGQISEGIPKSFLEKEKNARAFIIEELEFSENQIATYDSLRLAQKENARAINQYSRRLKRRYFDQLLENVPASETDSLADIIGANQADLDKSTYRHFEYIRGICDEQQKEKFDGMIREIFKMIMPPPRHGPPPHGKRPGGRRPEGGPPLDGPRPDGPRRKGPPPEGRPK